MTAQLHLRGKRQRTKLLPPLEFRTQCAVADVLRRWAAPNWAWTHIGHGEQRSPVTGARLKRMGVQPGWPDFILLPPRYGQNPRAHFLELKRQGGQLSEAQAGFQLWCSLNGYRFAIAHDLKGAFAILLSWGAVRSGIEMQ